MYHSSSWFDPDDWDIRSSTGYDGGLTVQGIQQARESGKRRKLEYLEGMHPCRRYVSRSQRALETQYYDWLECPFSSAQKTKVIVVSTSQRTYIWSLRGLYRASGSRSGGYQMSFCPGMKPNRSSKALIGTQYLSKTTFIESSSLRTPIIKIRLRKMKHLRQE